MANEGWALDMVLSFSLRTESIEFFENKCRLNMSVRKFFSDALSDFIEKIMSRLS